MAPINEVVVGGGGNLLEALIPSVSMVVVMNTFSMFCHLLLGSSFFPQYKFPTWLLDVIWKKHLNCLTKKYVQSSDDNGSMW